MSLAAVVLLAGCGGGFSSGGTATPRGPVSPTAVTSPGVVSHGGAVREHVGFVDHLRERGLMVQPVDTVRRAPLLGEGVRLRVAGPGLAGNPLLESYGYSSAEVGSAELERDVAEVVAGRVTAAATGEKRAAAHWYRGDRLLVLYRGSDPAVRRLLNEAFGDALQITGRR